MTVKVLNTPLQVCTYESLQKKLLFAKWQKLAIDFSNTHIVTMRRNDQAFRALTDSVDLFVPDGMPLIWTMNRLGADLSDRVYGPMFTRYFLAECPSNRTHYLIGGSPECGERFRTHMLQLNPSLRFVGGAHGKCSADGIFEKDDQILQELQTLSPDFIWVGLGAPKQYAWIHRIKPHLSHGVLLAVGFAFDVIAGTKKDAPSWMQRSGLTWLFRSSQEPIRLLGRYAKYNTLFCFYLLKDGVFLPKTNGNRSVAP